TVARRWVGVAHRTDDRLSPGEELPAMTPDARRMLGIIGDIREGRRARSNLVKVCRRNLMARVASHLVLSNVVGELRIIARCCFSTRRLRKTSCPRALLLGDFVRRSRCT